MSIKTILSVRPVRAAAAGKRAARLGATCFSAAPRLVALLWVMSVMGLAAGCTAVKSLQSFGKGLLPAAAPQETEVAAVETFEETCTVTGEPYRMTVDENQKDCWHSLPKSSASTQRQDEITIYTVLDEGQLSCYLPVFEKEHPDVPFRICRDSNWELARQILAEKDDPRLDVIWGLSATALVRIQAEGMLEPYEDLQGLDRINAGMRDPGDAPHWFGHDVWMSAFCVNTTKVQALGLPVPRSWLDLTNPAYKGQIAMPNPKASGTGFLSVSALIQLFSSQTEKTASLRSWAAQRGLEGEAAAWAYMDALHQNIVAYTDSGSKPCKMAQQGEVAVGISYDAAAVFPEYFDYPIEAVFPMEGSGWDIEAVALVRKQQIKPAAKIFMDWSVSESAMVVYSYFYPLTAVPLDTIPPAGYVDPPYTQQLIPNRLLWASANYERIVTKWLERYKDKTQTDTFNLPNQ